VGACTIGDVSQDFRPVLELNPVDTVGKRLHHDPLHEWEALGHERRLYQTTGNRGYLPLGPHPSPARKAAIRMGLIDRSRVARERGLLSVPGGLYR
jgi:hypothetical protein